VVAQGVDPTTLDPMNHQEAPATVLANNLFDGLIERDPDLNLVPLLAESYQSVSPTAWEFKLRRGVRFHNGEPFDAESVKFSLERLVDPKLKSGSTRFENPQNRNQPSHRQVWRARVANYRGRVGPRGGSRCDLERSLTPRSHGPWRVAGRGTDGLVTRALLADD
jgi:ABC-type transport system substrate-binding protein